MSRKHAKLAKMSDLQYKESDYILTRGDILMIISGLWALNDENMTPRQKQDRFKLYCKFSRLITGH